MFNYKSTRQTLWLYVMTIIFSVLLFLPIIFLVWREAIWITSEHITTVWAQNSEELPVNPSKTIGQSFLAAQNNLAKIAVRVHRGSNDNQARYVFTLKDSPESSRILRQGQFSLEKIFRTAYFQFAPIPDSASRSFYFSIEPVIGATAAVGIFKSVTDLPQGDLYINNEKKEGDMVFQIYFAQPINFKTFLTILFNRMSQYKPGFLKAPYLYAYWLLFMVSLIWLIYILLQQLVFNDGQLSLKTKVLTLLSLWFITLLVFLWIQTQAPVFYLS